MNINYHLAEFDDPYYVFRIEGEEPISINLSVYFPKYRLPKGNLGSDYWQFTIIKNKSINPYYKIGDIHLFKQEEIRKISTLCKEFSKSNVLFRKTTQVELDKYEYEYYKNTDNAQVYKLIIDTLDKRRSNKEKKAIKNEENKTNLKYIVTEV